MSHSENRRLQCTMLRDEMNQADKTCVEIMGFLITVTGLAGAAFAEKLPPFAGWLLSPIWLIGFWYFTEKRFVIIRNAAYIRNNIEPFEPGLEWESYIERLSQAGKMRRVLPFDPYYLEAFVTALVVGSVPWLGWHRCLWFPMSFFFLSGVGFFLIYLALAFRTVSEYGRPQEYELPADVHRK